jgi:hypothetical protein
MHNFRFLLIIFLVAITGLVSAWWHQHPANVVARFSSVSPPIWSEVKYESVQETWQDSHIIYVLSLDDKYSKNILNNCTNLGGHYGVLNFQDMDLNVSTTLQKTAGKGSSGCILHGIKDGATWDIKILEGVLYFNCYI